MHQFMRIDQRASPLLIKKEAARICVFDPHFLFAGRLLQVKVETFMPVVFMSVVVFVLM